jgi:hypothetical protein
VHRIYYFMTMMLDYEFVENHIRLLQTL